jgi:hypothetical protein
MVLYFRMLARRSRWIRGVSEMEWHGRVGSEEMEVEAS